MSPKFASGSPSDARKLIPGSSSGNTKKVVFHVSDPHHAHGYSWHASRSGWWKQSHIQKFLPIKEAWYPFDISGGAGGAHKARVRESVL